MREVCHVRIALPKAIASSVKCLGFILSRPSLLQFILYSGDVRVHYYKRIRIHTEQGAVI